MPPHPRTARLLAGVTGLLASLACGWQVYQLMRLGIWGAPRSPLHPVALVGAAGLFVASVVLIITRGRWAAVACLAADVALCAFYAPATVSSLSVFHGSPDLLHLFIFGPPLLLLACTALAAYGVWRPDPPPGPAADRGFEVRPGPPT